MKVKNTNQCMQQPRLRLKTTLGVSDTSASMQVKVSMFFFQKHDCNIFCLEKLQSCDQFPNMAIKKIINKEPKELIVLSNITSC